MAKVYISERANGRLARYLAEKGREVVYVRAASNVYAAVSAHPDIYMCAITDGTERRIIRARVQEPGFAYPDCIAFNALCLDKYFVHNLRYTDARLLNAAVAAGKQTVNVRQGYTKCSAVVVDGESVITADNGLAAALEALGDVNVLRIQPGYVSLPGHSYGFLGGASGRVDDELVFSGDLSVHPDFAAICDFVQKRGVKLKYFPEYPLEDIGSIIEDS